GSGAARAGPPRAPAPPRRGGAGEYEDDPTLPWWDRPEQEPAPRPHGRLLLYAVLLLLVLLLVTVVGAVVLG
ncbi:XRE family transcriptional regulator, partial [Streptomyces sp. NPDC059629]